MKLLVKKSILLCQQFHTPGLELGFTFLELQFKFFDHKISVLFIFNFTKYVRQKKKKKKLPGIITLLG